MQKQLTLGQTLSFTKIRNVEDLIQNIDAILDLAKDDVKRLANAQNVYFMDFNHFYYEALKVTKKNIINRTKAFSQIVKCENIEKIISWVIGRIFSNMRNFSTNEKYRKYVKIEKIVDEIDAQVIDENNEYLQIDIENDLEKIDREKMINGLKKIYHNLDSYEFENLCRKYAIEPVEVLGFNSLEMPEMTTEKSESGLDQLAFVF